MFRFHLKFNAQAIALAAVCGITFAAYHPVTHAGGAVAGATEITQILNNVQLNMEVSESMMQTAEAMEQTYLQAQQLYHDIQNLKQLPDNLSRMTLGDYMREYDRLMSLKSKQEALYGSLEQLGEALERRQIEAMNDGMTTEQYVKRQADMVANNNLEAQLRIKREQGIIEAISEDHRQINEMAAQINQTAGMQQSLALMNTQMNKSLQQLSRISQIMSDNNQNVEKANELSRANEKILRNQKSELESMDRAKRDFDAMNELKF